jgi:protein phosphatase
LEPQERSLNERYLLRGSQVVLDTQPGFPLASAFDITDALLPYLRLFSLRLHLPQLYSLVSLGETEDSTVLLEGVPFIPADFNGSDAPAAEVIQEIATAAVFTEAWSSAPILRQVNWLWQVAQLWTPLQREGVAHSLINPDLLRVEGPLLRLRELEYSSSSSPSLTDLGLFWAKWCAPYVDRWRPQFTELCDRLVEGRIDTLEELSSELESWLAAVRSLSRVRIDVATRTDPGPTREQNEDACYPLNGTVLQNTQEGLAIVCDGVGGHAGGEVASSIAINVLMEHLQQVDLSTLAAADVMDELEVAVGAANDLIVDQNDGENRHDRDRMGTTVVMALAQEHDLYLTNLGDSRAYFITEQGCYQVTTDDDIGTREVRLGYLPYREAIRQPGSGSLIQALGMVPSSMLRPSVQRLVLDSDCLFLLCSDGLSDFERVESLWREELLPLLWGKVDLAETTKRLIGIANRLNGHDNVTVGILHCRVSASSQNHKTATGTSSTWPAPPQLRTVATATSLKHRVSEPGKRMPLLLILGLLVLLGGAALGTLLWRSPGAKNPMLPVESPSVPPPTLSPALPRNATADTYWRILTQPRPGITTAVAPSELVLRTKAVPTAKVLGSLSPDMVFKVNEAFTLPDATRSRWLQVQLCQVLNVERKTATSPTTTLSPKPTASATAPTAATAKPRTAPTVTFPTPPAPSKSLPQLKPSDIGYIKALDFEAAALYIPPEELGLLALEGCPPLATPPTP